ESNRLATIARCARSPAGAGAATARLAAARSRSARVAVIASSTARPRVAAPASTRNGVLAAVAATAAGSSGCDAAANRSAPGAAVQTATAAKDPRPHRVISPPSEYLIRRLRSQLTSCDGPDRRPVHVSPLSSPRPIAATRRMDDLVNDRHRRDHRK
ncbi:hypothetical protein ABT341_23565, partial [Pseudonocardia alni]|uniref:hypothetical protein n=1 Tax=Pseudonocardia alni TaxID=33907 RepID=UPI00331C973A